MKKTMLFTICLLSSLMMAASPVRTVNLDNGLTVGVEICSDAIFRVCISPRDSFTEALLNRYGVVKTDWKPVESAFTHDEGQPAGLNERYIFQTAKGSLTIAKADGAICLKDASGRVVVQDILFRKPGSPEVR